MTLTPRNHDRDAAGMTYVYPVVSRRAGGISIGINLNPNNACNWRCVYCQVPNLRAGRAPAIDLAQLKAELERMLALVRDPQWLESNVPAPSRALRDIAFSGNGEPTSARELEAAIELAARARADAGVEGSCALTLITNGSLAHLEQVRRALARLASHDGEVWFKLDAADDAGIARINSSHNGVERARRNLASCARACRTWVQTIAFDWNGPTLAGESLERYCALLEDVLNSGAPLAGVRLYGLARQSHQPEAEQLRALTPEALEALAQTIRARTRLEVRVSA